MDFYPKERVSIGGGTSIAHPVVAARESWDFAVDAHVYSGYTYDYYFKRRGRRGLDDEGLAAINFVLSFARARGSITPSSTRLTPA